MRANLSSHPTKFCITGLLREVVQDHIIEHLKAQGEPPPCVLIPDIGLTRYSVKTQMADVIDAMVAEGVAEQLKLYAPESLQATLIEQKRQIAEVRQALHNS